MKTDTPRVVWSEGMLMAPQHLQQQDFHLEALLDARVSAVHPYPWGVIRLEPDAEALRAGQVQFHRITAILPDGTPISVVRGHPESPPVRPLDAEVRGNQGGLEVWLGLRKEREGSATYSDEPGGRRGRYQVVNRPVVDVLAPESVVSVPVAQRNFCILFGTESREDFECLQVAVITRDGNGALTYDATFVPPSLRIDASPFVMAGLREAVERLLGKQRELTGTRRQRNAAAMEVTAADVTRTLQLHALNGVLPVLNHIAEAGDAHPHLAYLTLLQAAGQLSTFSDDGDVAALPRFAFTALSESFGGLFARIRALLKTVALDACLPVSLETRPGGLQVGKLDDDRFARCSEFILAVKSELPEQQVADQLPRLSKIASTGEIHRIVQAASSGVPLTVTFRPPPEVPVRPGVVYFSLATQDPYWKNALRDRAVALYLPAPFDSSRTQIELLGVPGPTR